MPTYKASDKTKDGRQWYFQISQSVGGSNRKYKSKRYATKKEAEKAEALFLLNNGKHPADSITFDMLIVEYLADKKSTLKPQSWLRAKVLCGHISACLGNVPVATMSKSQFEQFRTTVTENALWSVSYKNKVLNHCKALCTYADKKHDVINRLPFKYEPITDPAGQHKPMQFYTKSEFDAFIAVADDLRFLALFNCLFYCGLRVGEANSLQWSDVDIEQRTLSVSKTVTTKIRDAKGNYLITTPKTAGSIRTIPFPKKIADLFRQLYGYWRKYDCFSNEWFVFGGLHPLPETTITKAKDKYIKAAGTKRIRIHDFRHSTASYYVHIGCSPNVLAKLLGHTSAKMTLDTYSHFYTDDLRELVDKAE